MRDLISVVSQIKEEVPDTFERKKELIAQLDDRCNSYFYTAPELMWLRWQEVGETLGLELGEPDTDWKKRIVDIFSDTTKSTNQDNSEENNGKTIQPEATRDRR